MAADPKLVAEAMRVEPTLFSDWNLIMPMVIPLVVASISVMLRRQVKWQFHLAMIASILTLIASISLFMDVLDNGTQNLTLSGWLAPYGIAFTADMTSALFTITASIVALLILLYSQYDVDKGAIKSGYYTLILMLLVGVNGAFLTGDIFNLYVWFEVMLISSFGLLILGGNRVQLDGAIKYAFLNLLGTTFFLIAVGLLYGLTGTLNFADLYAKVASSPEQTTLWMLSFMFIFGFGIKAAAFPMYFWLPAAYHTPRISVSAIFAGLLTKVGAYALIRIFSIVYPDGASEHYNIFALIGAATILMGGIGAMAQTDIRKVLAFVLMSGVGMLFIGLGINSGSLDYNGDPIAAILGRSGMVLYAIHSMLVLTGLYLLVGVIGRMAGSFEISKMGGIVKQNHYVAILFFGLALAVAGLPPFSGLWPKFMMVLAATGSEQYYLIAAMLVGSFLTLIGLGRASIQMIWRGGDVEVADGEYEARGNRIAANELWVMLSPIIIIFILSLLLGLIPNQVIKLATEAGAALIGVEDYVKAVLGGV